MIAADQPTCFDGHVVVALSSKSDGTMLDKSRGVHHADIVANRKAFCAQSGIEYADVVYQRIQYGHQQTYDVLREVTRADTSQYTNEVPADGLFTRQAGVGLFLPVADCTATVVYDPVRHMVALLHLGRHSSLTNLIEKTVGVFKSYGSAPNDLIVWMSPNAQQSHYRMEYFDAASTDEWRDFVVARSDGYYIDIQGHNTRVFESQGVLPANIYPSPHNTAAHDDYYSHSQGDTALRFAVLTYLAT